MSSLPRSRLVLDGTTLIRFDRDGNVQREHDLTDYRVRVEHIVHGTTVACALVCLGAGIGLKLAIPFRWLGWVVLAVCAINAALFALGARMEILVLERDGEKVDYALFGRPDEIAEFRACVLGVRTQRAELAAVNTG
jgi:hypothetical protein